MVTGIWTLAKGSPYNQGVAKLIGSIGAVMIWTVMVVLFAALFWALFGTTVSLLTVGIGAFGLYWLTGRRR